MFWNWKSIDIERPSLVHHRELKTDGFRKLMQTLVYLDIRISFLWLKDEKLIAVVDTNR